MSRRAYLDFIAYPTTSLNVTNTSQKHSFLTFHRKQNQHILGCTSHCGIFRTPVLVSTLCTVTERPWTKRHHIFSESYDQQLPDFDFQCIFPKCIFALVYLVYASFFILLLESSPNWRMHFCDDHLLHNEIIERYSATMCYLRGERTRRQSEERPGGAFANNVFQCLFIIIIRNLQSIPSQ